MAEMELLLIAGRSLKQGTGLNMGKDTSEYQEAVSVIELCAQDIQRLGLAEGDAVLLCSPFGDAQARCRRANLPEGMAFMAYGPPTSRLMGTETYATGMPDSKQIQVVARPVAKGGDHAI